MHMCFWLVILPQEFEDHFELNDVSEEKVGAEMLLHLYLEEKDEAPEGREDLIPNGYYDEMRINDFPIRDHRTVLHIRRRRWKDKGGKTREARQGRQDKGGKTVSKDWQLVAKGTRHSNEFAAFLKEFLGYIPDYSQITGSAISHKGR